MTARKSLPGLSGATGSTRGRYAYKPRHAYKPRPAGSLKAATVELIETVGGIGRAADLAGRSTSEVHRWGDSSDENMGRSIPAAELRALEQAAGRPIVSAFLAAEAGGLVLPPGAGGASAAIEALDVSALAKLAKETAEAVAALAEGLADGRFTPEEAGRAVTQIDEAQAVLGGVRLLAVAVRDGGEPLA